MFIPALHRVQSITFVIARLLPSFPSLVLFLLLQLPQPLQYPLKTDVISDVEASVAILLGHVDHDSDVIKQEDLSRRKKLVCDCVVPF